MLSERDELRSGAMAKSGTGSASQLRRGGLFGSDEVSRNRFFFFIGPALHCIYISHYIHTLSTSIWP